MHFLTSGREAPCCCFFGLPSACLGIERHYLGRIFATLASLTLDLPVYDTQCGAKLFRATGVLSAALKTPFLSRWIFDVELLARFIELRSSRAVLESTFEFPLRSWRDVPGSKVNASAFAKAAAELWRIHRRYRMHSSPAADVEQTLSLPRRL
jgi:hypothetical protein